ncbi:hypothetical protein BC835DRAFT_1422720 [Cytidiella melzeri]|nr:hypothetical protein BC835DRAFT_1422720 [Cytidiella melzeri]
MDYALTSIAYSLSIYSGAAKAAWLATISLWGTLKTHLTAGYHDARARLPLIRDVAVNLPHVFSPTPEEYAQRARMRQRRWNTVLVPIETSKGVIYEPYTDQPPVAAGSVRVKLYRDMESLYRDSNLSVDVPLGPRGELDLRIIQREWSLQNCNVVDSTRLQFFPPSADNPNKLSGVAVRLLTDNQYWLRVIEQPSAGRIVARSIRRAVQQSRRNIVLYLRIACDTSLARRIKGCLSALMFIGGCFVATYCMDLFSMQYEFYLDDACQALWKMMGEAMSL